MGVNTDHTCDKHGDVDRRALYAHIAAAKHGAEQPGVGRVAHLGHFIAAVELRVAARLHGLLHRVVPLDSALVGGAVPGVLALVADVLVAFSVVAGRGDLSGDQGRR